MPRPLYAAAVATPARNSAQATAPFSRTPFSMPLRNVFASAGTLNRSVGRVSRMLTGMLRSVSIGLFPGCTHANAPPVEPRA